jgi:hypothetical protein
MRKARGIDEVASGPDRDRGPAGGTRDAHVRRRGIALRLRGGEIRTLAHGFGHQIRHARRERGHGLRIEFERLSAGEPITTASVPCALLAE